MTDKRRNATAALALGLLAAALPQNADAQQHMTANDLVPPCKDVIVSAETQAMKFNTAWQQGICVGIIAGLSAVGKDLPPGASWCGRQNVTIEQMVRVVVAYIERRPQRMHEDFRQLAVEAFHEAWPCK